MRYRTHMITATAEWRPYCVATKIVGKNPVRVIPKDTDN